VQNNNLHSVNPLMGKGCRDRLVLSNNTSATVAYGRAWLWTVKGAQQVDMHPIQSFPQWLCHPWPVYGLQWLQFKIAVMTYRVRWCTVHRYCWCPWSTSAAFCRNQSAGYASNYTPVRPSVAELSRLPPLKSGNLPEHIVSAPTLKTFLLQRYLVDFVVALVTGSTLKNH